MPDPQHPPSDPRLGQLEAEAMHASDRYRLYRAKAYGPTATSPRRLRELKRDAELAELRLRALRVRLGLTSA